MCNCKSEIEAKLLERYKAAQPNASAHSAELDGYGIAVIENKMVLRGYMPIKLSADHPTKAGGQKWKTEKGTMFFRFCPFCGERVVEGA